MIRTSSAGSGLSGKSKNACASSMKIVLRTPEKLRKLMSLKLSFRRPKLTITIGSKSWKRDTGTVVPLLNALKRM